MDKLIKQYPPFVYYYEKKTESYLRYLSGRNSSIKIDNIQLKVACWCPSKYSCLKPLFCLSTLLLVLIVVNSRSFLNAHTHFCKEERKLTFDKVNSSKVFFVASVPCTAGAMCLSCNSLNSSCSSTPRFSSGHPISPGTLSLSEPWLRLLDLQEHFACDP